MCHLISNIVDSNQEKRVQVELVVHAGTSNYLIRKMIAEKVPKSVRRTVVSKKSSQHQVHHLAQVRLVSSEEINEEDCH
jgi:hypothetical protein